MKVASPVLRGPGRSNALGLPDKSVRRNKGKRKQARVGASDASLTGFSGLAAVGELVEALGVARVLDRHVGPIKRRDRGLSGGEFLVSLATAQLLGEDCLAGFDRLRGDAAGRLLAPVPTPAQTTAGALARRFGPARLAGIEAAMGELAARWLALLPAARRAVLAEGPVTIDLDSTDVEVYGRAKAGVAHNYQGQRAGRPHLAAWAEAGLPLAADLMAGNDDVRPRCADLLGRALAGLPAGIGDRADVRPRVRADAGYFTADLAHAAAGAECEYAVAAKRNSAFWRELAAVDEAAWAPAKDMHGAQVAAIDYAPAGWPDDAYTIIRRVRVDADDISADPRSRRRRTIAADQLALVLGGQLDHTWAVSFIVTNLPTSTTGDVVDAEAWFRRRTDIEERFREAKLGAGLNHLPSGHAGVNAVWMWGALLATALSVMLQSLGGLDQAHGHARCRRLRHELLTVPARVVRHARGITIRLPPGRQRLPDVLDRLRALPAPA